MSNERPKLSRRFLSARAKIKRAERALKKNARRKILPLAKSSKDFKIILRHFIVPLVNNESMEGYGSIKHRLEAIFGTNYRQIITFVARDPFSIPGMIPEWQENAATASRKIKIGDILLIRTDIRTPNVVDVESIKNNIMYRLTAKQYVDILNKLERQTQCQMNEIDILADNEPSTD